MRCVLRCVFDCFCHVLLMSAIYSSVAKQMLLAKFFRGLVIHEQVGHLSDILLTGRLWILRFEPGTF